ncbi:ADR176Wp [Eremothecium gossypii ATCC 10895]|uniref:Nuclear distribution protein PAC1 n=1 Tax=Eremothecium gossypii (strain ATCC 10895 / CBS 109.51 / FGSC 9923 / NRRL Y-1056) TaxID=284811 RepID=LIS1_EREGS|nr:ADR176Wp [Eremothecium gossypii ATCC 10895]Q759U7.1 RecName: Full=Nuclear distribution protein PAC1; AltName: Full=Lissencephaly-1 homolog; Short=LIS-1; AltName: Full=nudF homolog [Eremothecium gossypii ATCC 10895]AAS52096.1 ADR176Wp [Eremothecium gossypii ATCC 10895]AEY96395.1 FADR176Wp [Eremothecium gossypii FDAG1]
MSQHHILPQHQRADLNRSICDYVQRCGAEESLVVGLRQLFGLSAEECDATRNGRDPDLLLKKWNSIIRLHRKILDLEQKCQQLTEELEAVPTEAYGKAGRGVSHVLWTPRSNPTFQLDVGASVTDIKLHPSLPIAFLATDQGKVVAYDLFNRSMPLHSTQAHMKGVTSLAVMEAENGSLLISTTSKDLQCKIWSFTDNAAFQLLRTLSSHEHIVSQSCFLRSGSDLLLATCSRDLTVKVWDTKSGWCIKSFQPHNQWVRTLELHGDYVITGSNDATIRLSHWPSGNGLSMAVMHEFPIERVLIIPMRANTAQKTEADDDQVELEYRKYDPDYSPLGFKYCISCSRDNLIVLWKIPLPKFIPHRPPQPNLLQTNFEKVHVFKGHTSWVRDIKVRGRHLFSCSDDRSIRCWDLVTGQCLKVWPEASHGFINCLSVDSDVSNDKLLRELFLSGSIDGKCNVFMR